MPGTYVFLVTLFNFLNKIIRDVATHKVAIVHPVIQRLLCLIEAVVSEIFRIFDLGAIRATTY